MDLFYGFNKVVPLGIYYEKMGMVFLIKKCKKCNFVIISVFFLPGTMELKYVVMTIIKILISVPTVLLLHGVDGSALMGGHYDNKNSTNLTYLIDYDVYDESPTNSSTHMVYFGVFIRNNRLKSFCNFRR